MLGLGLRSGSRFASGVPSAKVAAGHAKMARLVWLSVRFRTQACGAVTVKCSASGLISSFFGSKYPFFSEPHLLQESLVHTGPICAL
jgi:hypothetical protein